MVLVGVPVTVERSFGLVLASMGRQDTFEDFDRMRCPVPRPAPYA